MRNNKLNKTCMYLDRVVMKPIRLQSNTYKSKKNHYNNSIKVTSLRDVITSKKQAYNSQEIK